MERLNDAGQWIILMSFIISIGIFFLAIILNQSVFVGQTTAEGVLEFPKSDIQDLRNEIRVISFRYLADITSKNDSKLDIEEIAISNKSAIVNVTFQGGVTGIHYNNGVTIYNETATAEGYWFWDY